MKIIAYYTDSHKVLLENYFLPSLKETGFDLKNLTIWSGPQYDKDGSFDGPNFGKTMKDKLRIIIKVLEKAQYGDIFCYADADVQFFKNPAYTHLVPTTSLWFQSDGPDHENKGTKLCAGFMYIENTTEVRIFLKKILAETPRFAHDQDCLNFHKKDIDSILLPPNEFFNISHLNGFRVWSPEDGFDFVMPKEMAVHHANWTIGVENKIALMDLVRQGLGKQKLEPIRLPEFSHHVHEA